MKKNGAAQLSVVVDAGGGDIMGKTSGLLKQGGRVVVYGMSVSSFFSPFLPPPSSLMRHFHELTTAILPRHAAPKVTMTMREVMKNQRLLGSTMGSRQDLVDATEFMAAHRIVPVVAHILDGLASAEHGFRLLESGDHFGKIVIRIPPDAPHTFPAKL